MVVWLTLEGAAMYGEFQVLSSRAITSKKDGSRYLLMSLYDADAETTYTECLFGDRQIDIPANTSVLKGVTVSGTFGAYIDNQGRLKLRSIGKMAISGGQVHQLAAVN